MKRARGEYSRNRGRRVRSARAPSGRILDRTARMRSMGPVYPRATSYVIEPQTSRRTTRSVAPTVYVGGDFDDYDEPTYGEYAKEAAKSALGYAGATAGAVGRNVVTNAIRGSRRYMALPENHLRDLDTAHMAEGPSRVAYRVNQGMNYVKPWLKPAVTAAGALVGGALGVDPFTAASAVSNNYDRATEYVLPAVAYYATQNALY